MSVADVVWSNLSGEFACRLEHKHEGRTFADSCQREEYMQRLHPLHLSCRRHKAIVLSQVLQWAFSVPNQFGIFGNCIYVNIIDSCTIHRRILEIASPLIIVRARQKSAYGFCNQHA